jgi:sugar fermentation stimulation protein A
VVVVERPAAHRKTPYDLTLIEYHGRWVSVDSRLPSAIAAEALRLGAIPRWTAYTSVRREVVYHDSRLDIELTAADGRRCLIETKSCNLVEDGLALFPDAPTERGTRHLHTLIHAVQRGIGAGVLFIIQRDDAELLRPFDSADPAFGRALRAAAAAGVAVLAYRCRLTPEDMTLDAPVPVDLSPNT